MYAFNTLSGRFGSSASAESRDSSSIGMPILWHPSAQVATYCRIVFRQMDEQASGVVNAWRSDLLQDHVFADAFLRRFGILYDVAAAAMQESMAAAGSSVGQVFLLQQDSRRCRAAQGPTEDLHRWRLRR